MRPIQLSAIFALTLFGMLQGCALLDSLDYETTKNVSGSTPELFGLRVGTKYVLPSPADFHKTYDGTIRIASDAPGLRGKAPDGTLDAGTVLRIGRSIEHHHLNFGTRFYLEGKVRSGVHKGTKFKVWGIDKLPTLVHLQKKG